MEQCTKFECSCNCKLFTIANPSIGLYVYTCASCHKEYIVKLNNEKLYIMDSIIQKPLALFNGIEYHSCTPNLYTINIKQSKKEGKVMNNYCYACKCGNTKFKYVRSIGSIKYYSCVEEGCVNVHAVNDNTIVGLTLDSKIYPFTTIEDCGNDIYTFSNIPKKEEYEIYKCKCGCDTLIKKFGEPHAYYCSNCKLECIVSMGTITNQYFDVYQLYSDDYFIAIDDKVKVKIKKKEEEKFNKDGNLLCVCGEDHFYITVGTIPHYGTISKDDNNNCISICSKCGSIFINKKYTFDKVNKDVLDNSKRIVERFGAKSPINSSNSKESKDLRQNYTCAKNPHHDTFIQYDGGKVTCLECGSVHGTDAEKYCSNYITSIVKVDGIEITRIKNNYNDKKNAICPNCMRNSIFEIISRSGDNIICRCLDCKRLYELTLDPNGIICDINRLSFNAILNNSKVPVSYNSLTQIKLDDSDLLQIQEKNMEILTYKDYLNTLSLDIRSRENIETQLNNKLNLFKFFRL